MTRVVWLATAVILSASWPVAAQDRGGSVSSDSKLTAKTERTMFVVRNADPHVLAEVVGAHYKGDVSLIAVPAGSGNAVLVSGPSASVAEVLKLLSHLDRAPRSIEIEVTIVEVPAKKDGQDVVPSELTPEALLKAGQGQRIKLTAVEGQQVTSTSGGNKPVVSNTTVAGGGGRAGGGGFGGGAPVTQRSITYQPVGTTVKLTARVGTDDVVSLELSVQDSRVRTADAGDESGAASFENATLNTKLGVPSGKSVIAQTVKSESKTGTSLAVILVSARVVDVDASRLKQSR